MKLPLDWATNLSENHSEPLGVVKDKRNFYMTSYLVYLLVARVKKYHGLYKRGSMEGPNASPYRIYPQIVKKKLLV